MLRVGRLAVTAIGTAEAGIFGLASAYGLLYGFTAGGDPTALLVGAGSALVAVGALAGAAGTLGRRVWGSVLVAATSAASWAF